MMGILLVVLVLVIAGWGFREINHPRYGHKPTGSRRERILASPNFRAGQFRNLEDLPQLTNGANFGSLLVNYLFSKPRDLRPREIPVARTSWAELNPQEEVMIWFGHSSYFLQLQGKTFLIDPVFSDYASPVPGTNKAFPGTLGIKASDLPPIDYLLITHDHWDHLDYPTLLELKSKTTLVYTGLGTGAHLEHWGFSPKQIHEGDWGDAFELSDGLRLTVTPAQHFSGRLFNRNSTLWCSFVLETPSRKIFLGGDSGYGDHFKAIGQSYGPFDLAILENGQYNKFWQHIHMLPEEVQLAGRDLQAQSIIPVHSCKFALAMHPWYEPLQEVGKQPIEVHTPMIGEKLDLRNPQTTSWWLSAMRQ